MNYDSKIQNEQVDQLCKAFLQVETMEECYKFIEDICTIKEVQAIAQRFEVAKLLKSDNTYTQIEEATGASTATISRINRSLEYGVGGYKLVFKKMGLKY